MGLFSSIAKIAKPGAGALMSLGRTISKVPGAKAIPILGTGLAAFEVANLASKAMGGGRSAGLPMLPGVPAPGMPGSSMIPMGDRSIFRNDPNVIAALQQFAIPAAALRPYFRAPKGFIVLRDQKGDPYGLPKVIARAMKLWKAQAKPPISVGDWQSVKRADRTIKKMRRIVVTMARVDKSVSGGKIKIKRRAK